jgi:hypothetical protein
VEVKTNALPFPSNVRNHEALSTTSPWIWKRNGQSNQHLIVIDEVVFYPHASTPVHAKRKSHAVSVVAEEQDCAVSSIVRAAYIKLHSLRLHSAKISRQTIDLPKMSSTKLNDATRCSFQLPSYDRLWRLGIHR